MKIQVMTLKKSPLKAFDKVFKILDKEMDKISLKEVKKFFFESNVDVKWGLLTVEEILKKLNVCLPDKKNSQAFNAFKFGLRNRVIQHLGAIAKECRNRNVPLPWVTVKVGRKKHYGFSEVNEDLDMTVATKKSFTKDASKIQEETELAVKVIKRKRLMENKNKSLA